MLLALDIQSFCCSRSMMSNLTKTKMCLTPPSFYTSQPTECLLFHTPTNETASRSLSPPPCLTAPLFCHAPAELNLVATH